MKTSWFTCYKHCHWQQSKLEKTTGTTLIFTIYREREERTLNIFCNFLMTMKMLFVSGGPCVNIQGRGVCLSPICLYSNWLQIPAQCLLWAGFCRGRWMELDKGNLWIRSKPIEVTYLNRIKNSTVMSYKVIKVSSSVLVSNVKTINTDKSSRNTILKPQTNSVFATHWDYEKVDWYQYSIVIEIRTHKRFGRVKTISVLVPTIICLALKCCLTFCIMNLPSYH